VQGVDFRYSTASLRGQAPEVAEFGGSRKRAGEKKLAAGAWPAGFAGMAASRMPIKENDPPRRRRPRMLLLPDTRNGLRFWIAPRSLIGQVSSANLRREKAGSEAGSWHV
jgi:hypothetical protein